MSSKPSNRDSHLGKNIKGPDAFQAKALESLSFMDKHRLQIILGAVVLVVIAAGVWGFRAFKLKEQDKVAQKVAEVEKVFADEMKAAEEKRKAFQDQAAKLTPKDPAAAEPSQAVKDEMARLEKDMNAIKPDHSKSSELFGAFYKEYPKDPSGLMAGLRYAAFLASHDKKADAKKVLQDILAASSDWPIYQIQGRFGLIHVLEDLGEFEPAIKVSDELMGIVPKELAPKVLLTKGRLQFELKKPEEAVATLDKLVKEYAASMEADAARSLKAFILRG